MSESISPERRECQHCKHKPIVLPSGDLAFHYIQGPGVGLQCPQTVPAAIR